MVPLLSETTESQIEIDFSSKTQPVKGWKVVEDNDALRDRKKKTIGLECFALSFVNRFLNLIARDAYMYCGRGHLGSLNVAQQLVAAENKGKIKFPPEWEGKRIVFVATKLEQEGTFGLPYIYKNGDGHYNLGVIKTTSQLGEDLYQLKINLPRD